MDRDEQRRLEGIGALAVLDFDDPASLQRITRIAAALTGAESAGIHIIDQVAQHRIAGYNAPDDDWPREDSMCRLTIESGRAIVTGDATLDQRFAYSSYVAGETPVRFYASTPLTTELYGAIGTVCVWDTEAHEQPHLQLDGLADLADIAIELLEARRTMKLLNEAALTDTLTGLPNRRMVYDTLQRAIARRERDGLDVSVAFIDLDGFKPVNDAHGHEAGDALLQGVAHNLISVARRDEVVGRIGGDEFVVVAAAGLDRDEARARFVDAVRRPVDTMGGEVSVGASIGVALVEDGDTPDAVIRRADQDMFDVKRSRSRDG